MVAFSAATAPPAVARTRSAVSVLLFAGTADVTGVRRYSLSCGGTLTVREAFLRLCHLFPPLISMDGRLLYAVNDEFAGDSRVLRAGDQLSLIPPASCGAAS